MDERKENIEPDLRQFMNRLLSMDLDMQNRIFDAFEERIARNVQYAKDQGTYEEGVETLRAEVITRQEKKTVWEEEGKGKAEYVRLETRSPAEYQTFDYLTSDAVFARNNHSKQLWAFEPLGQVLDKETGNFIKAYKKNGITWSTPTVSEAELNSKFTRIPSPSPQGNESGMEQDDSQGTQGDCA